MMKRCENGHFYDPNKHTSCPHCGVSIDDFPATDRVRGIAAAGAAAAGAAGGFEPPTAPRRQARAAPSSPAPPPPPAAPGPRASAPGVTVAYWGKRDFDPVVGWLVCVEGPEQGRDYRIRSGNNRVGRDDTMDIVIRGDEAISRVKQAIITFDERNVRFRIKEGEGRGLIYRNGEQVVNAAVLEPWDILEMGKSRFCFVPLCSEKFQWNTDKNDKKEQEQEDE